MLKFLRDKAVKKKIFIGIGIIVIPSFLIMGAIVDGDKSPTGPVAGTFRGKKIPTGDFLQNLQSMRREILLMHGPQAQQLLGQIDLEKATWDRILLLREARTRRISTTNDEVIGWIGEQSAFKPAGQFEPAVYKRFVQFQLNMTPRDFEEDMREFLTLRKTIEALAPAPQLGEEDARRVFRERQAPRNLRYVLVASAEGVASTPVTDEDSKQIFEIVKDKLTSPDAIRVAYVMLQKGSASDTPENHEAIESGSIKDASGPGLTAADSGLITVADPLPQVGFSTAMSDALFALKNPGDRTAWIPTDKGFVLAELQERQAGRQLNYDEAKAEIVKRLTEQRGQEALHTRADQVRAAMAEKGFEAAAAEAKLEILEAKGHKPGDYLQKVGVISDFGARLGALKAGELSQPVLAQGGYAIVRVEAIDESFGEGWAEAKDRLIQEMTDTARSEQVSKTMQELWKDLKPNYETMGAIFPEKYASGAFDPLTQPSVPEPEPAAQEPTPSS